MNKKAIVFVHSSVALEDAQNRSALKLAMDKLRAQASALTRLSNRLARGKLDLYTYLFVDPMWTTMVLGKPVPPTTILPLADAVRHLQVRTNTSLQPHGFCLTALDLSEFIRAIGDRAGRKAVAAYFLGAGHLTYDGPKVVEAIIRIANIGRHIPVLRFDDDVLFARLDHGRLGNEVALAESIKALVDHYAKCQFKLGLDYYMFSGSYQEGSDYLNGFAARLNPACKYHKLPPDPPGVVPLDRVHYERRQAKRFFDSLPAVGADPCGQVVSGAGLCLSSSAILDLPPFSNIRRNVLWIDDHLKYALHDELDHFGIGPSPHVSRIVDAKFSQERGRMWQKWTVEAYMPRLVAGCVVDAWLRDGTPIKRPSGCLTAKARARAKRPFGCALAEVLRMNERAPSRRSRMSALDGDLKAHALDRLKAIVELWGGNDFQGTIAWHYVHGLVGSAPGLLKTPLENRQASGLDWKDFDDGTVSMVDSLKASMLQYMDFVAFWPRFVQAVRWLGRSDGKWQWLWNPFNK